jgi:IclR family KDG regulon transcriptional repressor
MASSDPITICPLRVGGLVGTMAGVDSFFVIRTMQALEVLAFQPSTAPQVAEVLRVDARTARRLLNRLTDEGWLVRTEGRVRTYTLSLRLVALAAHFLERSTLTRAATSAVRALHESTGGVAHLTVPSYRSVLCVAQRAEGPHPRPYFRELIPAHASAGGKVLLAHRQPWRESVLELPLERVTDRTVVDPDAVRSQCEATLAQGFAFEDGEYRDGLQGVAVPVPDGSGDVMAAIALTGPPELDVAGKVDAVAEAAGALALALVEDGIARAA